MLETHASVLNPEMRMSLVKALMLLSSKKLVLSVVFLPLCFKLFRVHDKELRKLVYQHILQDIKRHNKGKKNLSLNKQMQNFMYTMLQDPSEIAQKKSLDVMIDLYRRQIWKDAKTVNVMAQACLSEGKVVGPALRFFIDPNNLNPEEDEEADRKRKNAKLPVHKRFSQHSKARKSKTRKIREAKAEEVKEEKKKRRLEEHDERDYPAIDMLYDPQGFSEKLLKKLKKGREPFDVRILMMRLISRCIKRHKLQLEQFYPYLQKYMQPHQEHITLILLSVVESCHELVSPESLEPIIKVLMREFVTDYRPGPMIQLGINTLREMSMRCPLALDQDTVRQIAQFKGYEKDKGVVAAARGVINLFRVINPGVLERKDRGKEAQMNLKDRVPQQYGETKVLKSIPGLGEALRLEDEEGEFDEDDEMDSDDEEDSAEVRKRMRALKRKRLAAEQAQQEGADDDDAPNLVYGKLPLMEGEEQDSDEEDDNDEDEDDDDDEDDENVMESEEEESGSGEENDEEDDGDDEEQEQEAIAAASTRIITSAEFRRLERLKREREEAHAESVSHGGVVYKGIDPDRDVEAADLSAWKPRKKSSKEERVEAIKEGREDREDYWTKKKRDKDSGSSNVDKLRNKPYQMSKQSGNVKAKQALSMQERQMLATKRALRRKGIKFQSGSGIQSNRKLVAASRKGKRVGGRGRK